jgi:hypothetical protein
MVDDADIQIDPALLSQDGGELQDDLDAEGEVDDGVGYYMPVRPSCVSNIYLFVFVFILQRASLSSTFLLTRPL